MHIPPPNAPQATLPTRCVAVAMHHGYSFEILELQGPFPDYHVQSVPNPHQAMTEQDIQGGDASSFLQRRAQAITQYDHLPEHDPYTQHHRLGEADVPGPEAQESHETRWALGAINPTGLAVRLSFSKICPREYMPSPRHTSRQEAKPGLNKSYGMRSLRLYSLLGLMPHIKKRTCVQLEGNTQG